MLVDTREFAGAGFQGNKAGPSRAAGRRLTPLL